MTFLYWIAWVVIFTPPLIALVHFVVIQPKQAAFLGVAALWAAAFVYIIAYNQAHP